MENELKQKSIVPDICRDGTQMVMNQAMGFDLICGHQVDPINQCSEA